MKISQILLKASPLLVLQSAPAQPVTFQVVYPYHASGVRGITASEQAGYFGAPGVSPHAALWIGSAGSYVDLNPVGSTFSEIYAMSGNQQVGFFQNAAGHFAGLWTGTAASIVNLNPAGADVSTAFGIRAGQEAGSASFGAGMHAGYWSGTAASWVDLNPVGAQVSGATCTTGTQQGGWFYMPGGGDRAALWSGTANSLINLHPAGGDPRDGSVVLDLTPEYQVGTFDPFAGNQRAVMWFGSAQSMRNMNPSGATSSVLYAAAEDYQVGYAVFGGQMHAGLWKESAGSFMDLEPYVSPFFNHGAEADSICVDNGTVYIGGTGYRDGYDYAVTWTIAVPEPAVSSLYAVALLCACTAKTSKQKWIKSPTSNRGDRSW